MLKRQNAQLTRGSNYSDLTGKISVFYKNGRTRRFDSRGRGLEYQKGRGALRLA